MKTGIIIGTYNNSDHIEDTISSIRSQEYTDWTCVLVDNGSTDDTSAKIQQLIEGDTRFHFYRKSNEGPSSGRNFGIKQLAVDIKYIHFLDGDDKLHPLFLKKLVSYMETNPEVGLLGCQFEVIDEKGNFVKHGYRSRFAPGLFGIPRPLGDLDHETPFETFFSATGQGPFALFRKSVFDLTTGYEESFWSHEDSDIFCQMALHSSVHYIPDRLYLKRKHSHNLTGSSKADYSKFRHKWDNYFSNDATVNKRIEKALQYYYGIHAPLRHFKISKKAAKEFMRNRKKSSLAWSLVCFKNGFVELFLRKAVIERFRQRHSATPHLTSTDCHAGSK